jgi:CheY-like chemotaxis protein
MDGVKKTVCIVDDDPDFISVIRQILEMNGDWEIQQTFGDLESFNAAFPGDLDTAHAWIPDLLVLDIFSSSAPPDTDIPITGVHVAIVLRNLGMKCGVLFASSMVSETLLETLNSLHSGGWSFIKKSGYLKSAEVLAAAEKALLS